MKTLIALTLAAVLAACTPTPTSGGEEPTGDCPQGAKLCAD